MEIKELTEKKAFKVNYSNIRSAVLKCELDKKSVECKKALQDLGIEMHGDD